MTRTANGFPRLAITVLLLFVCVGASAPRRPPPNERGASWN
ncbi:MAG TPA: hypothetical protein VFQ80_14440 [Thermomicrobiales bacterium]|nr:hypothetical protein [Thermomicrobiales bacterium]